MEAELTCHPAVNVVISDSELDGFWLVETFSLNLGVRVGSQTGSSSTHNSQCEKGHAKFKMVLIDWHMTWILLGTIGFDKVAFCHVTSSKVRQADRIQKSILTTRWNCLVSRKYVGIRIIYSGGNIFCDGKLSHPMPYTGLKMQTECKHVCYIM